MGSRRNPASGNNANSRLILSLHPPEGPELSSSSMICRLSPLCCISKDHSLLPFGTGDRQHKAKMKPTSVGLQSMSEGRSQMRDGKE